MGDGAHITTVVEASSDRTLELRWNLEITMQELLGEFPHFDVDHNGRLVPLEYGNIDARKVAEYVMANLGINNRDKPCALSITVFNIITHKRADYLQFPLKVDCVTPPVDLTVDYHLFFAENPYHQGTWTVIHNNKPSLYYFWEDQRRQSHPLVEPTPLNVMAEFAGKGVHHILIGFDHLLFLFALLLPAVLTRERGVWYPVTQFKEAMIRVIKLVTAFTIAHSVTLTCAVLEWIWLPPSRWVESLIALSVLLAALNILFPVVRSSVLPVTFAFGLIHGFGFASVLMEYEIAAQGLLLSLLCFNLGVEIGQVLIVLLVFPILFILRNRQIYSSRLLPGVAVLISLMAILWLVDRSIGLQLIA